MDNEYYTLEEIWEKEEKEKVLLSMRETYLNLICESLKRLPRNIADDVFAKCKIAIPNFVASGFHYLNEMNTDVIIIDFYDENHTKKAKIELILHEIAHFHYKHKARLLHPEMTDKDIDRQEDEETGKHKF